MPLRNANQVVISFYSAPIDTSPVFYHSICIACWLEIDLIFFVDLKTNMDWHLLIWKILLKLKQSGVYECKPKKIY